MSRQDRQKYKNFRDDDIMLDQAFYRSSTCLTLINGDVIQRWLSIHLKTQQFLSSWLNKRPIFSKGLTMKIIEIYYNLQGLL